MFCFRNKAVAKEKLKMSDIQLDKKKALISVDNVFSKKNHCKKEVDYNKSIFGEYF